MTFLQSDSSSINSSSPLWPTACGSSDHFVVLDRAEMTDGDIVERVGKMLPSLFPEEFKSKFESADKQTIKNLVMLHKNQNFQKVSEGGRTRSQKRTQKILRAVELAFETDIENAKPSFNRQLLDWNQNRGHFKRLDVSNLKVMSSDIDCPENKDGKYKYSSIIICMIYIFRK